MRVSLAAGVPSGPAGGETQGEEEVVVEGLEEDEEDKRRPARGAPAADQPRPAARTRPAPPQRACPPRGPVRMSPQRSLMPRARRPAGSRFTAGTSPRALRIETFTSTPHAPGRAEPARGPSSPLGAEFAGTGRALVAARDRPPHAAWRSATNPPPKPGIMASTSAYPPPQYNAEDLPPLGVLDEDDEFEEFDVQDWNDTDTALAHLSDKNVYISNGNATSSTPSAPGATVGLSIVGGASGRTGEDHLWADNWDDDDVEDDFSKALRYVSTQCLPAFLLLVLCTVPMSDRLFIHLLTLQGRAGQDFDAILGPHHRIPSLHLIHHCVSLNWVQCEDLPNTLPGKT